MRISPIKSYIYKPNFTSTTRTTYFSNSEGEFTLPTYDRKLGMRISPDTKMISSNSTNFFRRDLDWQTIGKIFNAQFPKGKVNIYDFACSDGSEAYSLIITLIEQLGEKQAQRFFPIKASDVDPEIIRMANSGKISATDEDIFQIENMIKNGNIKKYFDVISLGYNKNILTPKEILTKNVIFEQKGITQGLDDVSKDEQNIILARNFWKYLSNEDLAKASTKLNQKTNKEALVVIGHFDLSKKCTPFFLEALGFDVHSKEDLSENILSKKNSPKTTDKEWADFISSNYPFYIPSYIR